MAKQNPAAPAASVPTNPLSALNPAGAAPQPVSSADAVSLPASGANPYTAAGAMTNPFAAISALGQNPAMAQPQSQGQMSNPMTSAQNPLATLLSQTANAPAQTAPAMPDGNALQQQLQLIQMLAAQGIPQEQWGTALQLLQMSNPGMAGMNAGQFPGFNTMSGQGAGGWVRPDSQTRDDRDRERDRDYPRSPPGYRRRSRSPGWDRRRTATPPRRRDSPVYGDYHNDSPARRGGDPRDTRGRRGDYRHRSPTGRKRRSPSPTRRDPTLPAPGPKLIEWDYSIGQGNIQVLSRTLFVGGVTSSEAHLRSLFGKHGIVQTCIVNVDKRHAFIKMLSRQDAVAARAGMESYRAGDMQLRVSGLIVFSFSLSQVPCLTRRESTDSLGCRIRSARLQ